jgi:hypothetical protein
VIETRREESVGVELTKMTSTVTSIHGDPRGNQSGALPNDQTQSARSRGAAPAVSTHLLLQLIEPSQPMDPVMTVRDQNGALLITDGPFAETKEQMLG